MVPADEVWTARALAPAKINLQLEVLGRRADGYHELCTWMLALDLCDEVRARPAADGRMSLRVVGPHASDDIPEDESNLVWRAAQAVLVEARAPDSGIELEIDKRIPSQSGLGGASADAAASVLATEGLLGIELTRERRVALVNELGSDCAFFVSASETGSGLCEGRGERVEARPSPDADWYVALVTPQVRVATRSAFAALGIPLSTTPRAPRVPSNPVSPPATRARALIFNELEEAATRSNPELRAWRELLRDGSHEHFCLSGSGSTFFGLYEERAAANEALEDILGAARLRGLAVRGSWVCRPAGSGARTLP